MTGVVTIALIGAGQRGAMFGELASSIPRWARVVAVAEPRAELRDAFARRHGLGPGVVFASWRELFASRVPFDAAIVCTQDRDHAAPALAALGRGCHLLLEKPMATSLEDCRALARAQERAGTITSVCHSLRYHHGFAALKEAAASGRIGRVITVDQLEQVAWWHHVHSYVRGNWAREDRSTFMLLAKSCHDIDFIAHLVPEGCRRVQSFGSLSYFTRAHAPAGSADRCTECALERSCAYSAVKLYVEGTREAWPAAVVSPDHSADAHRAAVSSGPYGRCAWKCDNDAVDHQVACLEFDGGATATFTMTAFTQQGGRLIRVHGTDGEIEFTEAWMEVRTFADGRRDRIDFAREEGSHGGGDARVLVSFLGAVRAGDPSLVRSDVHESLRTHAIVFAAERSRRQGRVVEMDEMES